MLPFIQQPVGLMALLQGMQEGGQPMGNQADLPAPITMPPGLLQASPFMGLGGQQGGLPAVSPLAGLLGNF